MKRPTCLQVLIYGLIGLAALTAIGFFALRAWAASAPPPANLGAPGGQLAACPPTPNCVTTQAGLATQQMAPLAFTGSAVAAQARLKAIVDAQARATLITETEGYLHYEFRSAAIGFIDDVQFVVDEAAGVIHFRSASRLGRGDANVNFNRMTAIAALWAAAP